MVYFYSLPEIVEKLKENKNSILSAVAFACSVLLGIISFGILYAAPMRQIVEDGLLSAFFLVLSLLNVVLYVLAWVFLVKTIKKKESLKSIPIIFSVFSFVNLLYLLMAVAASIELISLW